MLRRLSAIVVKWERFKSDGTKIDSGETSLQPLGNTQLNQFFKDQKPIEAGYVDVWTETANGKFTVRRVAFGEGVERVFPLHSPRVEKVDVTRQGKVRRSKLYYLRDRVGKSARVKAQEHSAKTK